MLNYRPKMFDEASEANISKDILMILISFIVVFMLTRAQKLIPVMISNHLLKQELANSAPDLQEKIMISGSDKRVMIPALFSTVLTTIVSIIYCRFFEERPVRSMGARKNGFLAHYLSGLLVGGALMSAIVLIANSSGAISLKLCENINYKVIVLFFLGFVVQGMSEEFLFRGFLLNSIGGAGYHTMLAVMITSVGHAFSHGLNNGFGFFTFFNLIIINLFFTLYMILFDNIWGVCALHSVWNFTQGNIFGISVSGNEEMDSVMRATAISGNDIITGGKFGIEGSIFTTAAVTVCIIVISILLFIKYRITQAKSAEQPV